MYAYLQKLSSLVWNFDHKLAKEESKGKSEVFPRVACFEALVYMLEATVTDNPLDRQVALEKLDSAKKLTNHYLEKKGEIDVLAEKIAELNKVTELEESIVPRKDLLYVGGKNEPIPPDTNELYEKRKEPRKPLIDAQELLPSLVLDLKALSAEILLWKAITQFMNRNFVKGAINIRSSWKKYAKLYKEIETNPDTYAEDVMDTIKSGYGTFLYSISFAPKGVLAFTLKVIGFKADGPKGLEMVWEIARRQNIQVPVVFLVLSANYLFLSDDGNDDPSESLSQFRPILDYCLSRWPNGLTFRFVASLFVKTTGHIESAIHHLSTGVSHATQQGIVPVALLKDLAHAYYYHFDYENAAITLERALAAPFDFTKKGLLDLHLASCYLQLGKREKIAPLLEDMRVMGKKFKNETYTVAKIKLLDQFAKNDDLRDLILSVSLFEYLYLWNDIKHMTKEHKSKCLKYFDAQVGELEKIQIPDVRAAAHVIRGRLIHADDKETAKKYYQHSASLKNSVKYEKQWIATAHYELAVYAHGDEDYQVASAQLKVVDNMKKYPFDDVLKTRSRKLNQDIRNVQMSNGDFMPRERSKTF